MSERNQRAKTSRQGNDTSHTHALGIQTRTRLGPTLLTPAVRRTSLLQPFFAEIRLAGRHAGGSSKWLLEKVSIRGLSPSANRQNSLRQVRKRTKPRVHGTSRHFLLNNRTGQGDPTCTERQPIEPERQPQLGTHSQSVPSTG